MAKLANFLFSLVFVTVSSLTKLAKLAKFDSSVQKFGGRDQTGNHVATGLHKKVGQVGQVGQVPVFIGSCHGFEVDQVGQLQISST